MLTFAPLPKRAFGIAIGAATGLIIMLLTLITLLHPPEYYHYLGLLSKYFYGYSICWHGALIGAFWGFVVGFVAGRFPAFCRNVAIAALLFITRTRSELAATRTFWTTPERFCPRMETLRRLMLKWFAGSSVPPIVGTPHSRR